MFPYKGPSEEHQIEMSEAACPLDELLRNWLDSEVASEAELKKRTLTNPYNGRPTWLENAHAWLDWAVFAAYSAGRPTSRTKRGAPKPARAQPATIQSSLGKVAPNSLNPD